MMAAAGVTSAKLISERYSHLLIDALMEHRPDYLRVLNTACGIVLGQVPTLREKIVGLTILEQFVDGPEQALGSGTYGRVVLEALTLWQRMCYCCSPPTRVARKEASDAALEALDTGITSGHLSDISAGDAAKVLIALAWEALVQRACRSEQTIDCYNLVVTYKMIGEYSLPRFGLRMEYMPGGDLAHRFASRVPLTAFQKLSILSSLSKAIAIIGESGVVHVDIKPGNILLNEAATKAKLGDFGSTYLPGYSGAIRAATERYAAPEFCLDDPEYPKPAFRQVVPQSMVWAFGIVLFQILHPSHYVPSEAIAHSKTPYTRGDEVEVLETISKAANPFQNIATQILRRTPGPGSTMAAPLELEEARTTIRDRLSFEGFEPIQIASILNLLIGCLHREPTARLTIAVISSTIDALLAATPTVATRAVAEDETLPLLRHMSGSPGGGGGAGAGVGLGIGPRF